MNGDTKVTPTRVSHKMMLGETVNERDEGVLGDDAYDRQVLLDAELWRAISNQEETTNQLCSSIYSAHLKVFRDTHGMLDGKLDPLEKKELQLRELAVLDEFQRRIHQAAKAMQQERRVLEATVNESRNTFAEDLELNLQQEEQARNNVEEEEEEGDPGTSNRAGGIHRAVKFLHRAIVTGGIVGFLSVELYKAVKKSGFNLRVVSKGIKVGRGRTRRSSRYDAIHTLPQITIPSCGTRDTVMSD